MTLKFCFGNSNISAGYAVANIHLLIRWFLIISISGVIDGLSEAEPVTITLLVLLLVSSLIQVVLIFGLWKRIRPILIFWMVVESLTALLVLGAVITACIIIEIIPGTYLHSFTT